MVTSWQKEFQSLNTYFFLKFINTSPQPSLLKAQRPFRGSQIVLFLQEAPL